AFQWGFDEGFKKIIVIGTDLWEVNDSLLKKAFEKLETHDYVIGPALDGGYYLLGMKTCTPSLFKNKKWSSETVLAATLSDLNENTVFLLEEKNDIDTLEDLKNMPELYQGLKLKFNDRKE
ncbi:glycosyltransferase, partial [Flavobacteriaceae bacterium]|nr:glycosyltransferase [Flavobacteriaceae bacterium]